MRTDYEFETPAKGCTAYELTTLIQGLDNLASAVLRLSVAEALDDALLLSLQGSFDESTDFSNRLLFDRIHMASPLKLSATQWVPSRLIDLVRRNYKLIYERVLFGDLERERRSIGNLQEIETLKRMRLDNVSRALDLTEKVQNKDVHDAVAKQLALSVEQLLAPFGRDLMPRPTLIKANIFEEPGDLPAVEIAPQHRERLISLNDDIT